MSFVKYLGYLMINMQFSRCDTGSQTMIKSCNDYPSGDGEIRTLDPLLARQVLSQLSYTPIYGLKWTRTTDLTLIRRAL